MLSYLYAALISNLSSSSDDMALRAAGPIISLIKNYFYKRDIRQTKRTLENEITSLDDLLQRLRQDVSAANKQNTKETWQQFGELLDAARTLRGNITSPDRYKPATWREKAIANRKTSLSLKEVGHYMKPAQETISSFRQNPQGFGLLEKNGLRTYLYTLDGAYLQRQENFDAPLRQFEMQHKGTAMAEACNRKRLELADARKAKGNEPEVDTYLGSVKTKLAQCAPEWLPFDYPNGHYLGDSSSWRVKLNDPKKVTAKHSQYFWHPLVITCEYVAPNKFGTINLHDEAKRARRFTDKYSVKAYVSSKAPEDFVQRVAGHSDPNMAVFLYETEKKQLTFNKESHKAPAFASYFAPEQQPRGIRDAIGLFAKGDVIAEDTLKARLGLPEEEIVQLENRDLLFFSSKPGFYSLNNPISKYSPDGGAA